MWGAHSVLSGTIHFSDVTEVLALNCLINSSFTTSIEAEKSMALDLFCPGKDQHSVLLFALQSFGTLREVGCSCRNIKHGKAQTLGIVVLLWRGVPLRAMLALQAHVGR